MNSRFLTDDADEEDKRNINSLPKLKEIVDTSDGCPDCIMNTVPFPICHAMKCSPKEREDNVYVQFFKDDE